MLVCLFNNDAEVYSMVIYCVFVIYDATVYGRTQERDIIYCGTIIYCGLFMRTKNRYMIWIVYMMNIRYREFV